jgi:hypothetical protein
MHLKWTYCIDRCGTRYKLGMDRSTWAWFGKGRFEADFSLKILENFALLVLEIVPSIDTICIR